MKPKINPNPTVRVTETTGMGFKLAKERGLLRKTNEEGIYECTARLAQTLHLSTVE